MKRWACRYLCVAVCFPMTRLEAEVISWFSDANKTNLDGAGVPMDSGFQFSLGVFSGGFVPTNRNVDQWSSHWVAAASTSYNATTRRFAGQFTVADNHSPFLIGAHAWVYGHRITPTGTDRILFRNTSWTWPAPDPMNPLAIEWNASAAGVVVLGTIHGGGSPFLMKSATMQTFAQWQAEHLAGEPLDGGGDDPDHDGSPNLLEYVFGTLPKTAGPPVSVPVTLAGGHVRISIPRRIDRPAVLTVEVSGNLSEWRSGASATEIVEDGPAALIVRDLTPPGPSDSKRFMRLKVEPLAP